MQSSPLSANPAWSEPMATRMASLVYRPDHPPRSPRGAARPRGRCARRAPLRSTTVEATPPGTRPPSSVAAGSSESAKAIATSSASSVSGSPERFALDTASGPAAASSASVTGWSGTRNACVAVAVGRRARRASGRRARIARRGAARDRRPGSRAEPTSSNEATSHGTAFSGGRRLAAKSRASRRRRRAGSRCRRPCRSGRRPADPPRQQVGGAREPVGVRGRGGRASVRRGRSDQRHADDALDPGEVRERSSPPRASAALRPARAPPPPGRRPISSSATPSAARWCGELRDQPAHEVEPIRTRRRARDRGSQAERPDPLVDLGAGQVGQVRDHEVGRGRPGTAAGSSRSPQASVTSPPTP